MAAPEETRIAGWRLLVVVGATFIALVAMVLAIRASFSRDKPPTTSLVSTSLRSPSPEPTPMTPTLDVALAPLSSGDVTVTEVLTTDPPLTSLELRPPPRPDDGPAPQVLDLQVDAGVVRISVPTSDDGPWQVRLPARSNEVTLTYRLVGAASQSVDAADRRALVQMRPLAYAAGAAETTVVVAVNDVVVHNIVCPDVPQTEQLCGREGLKRWKTVELPANLSTVVAQVDLPES